MAKKRPSPAKAPATKPNPIDRLTEDQRKLAESARAKLAAGKKPTEREKRANRAVEKAYAEVYGETRVAAYPKGQFCEKVNHDASVVIDLFRRLGVKSYDDGGDTLDRNALDFELVNLLLEHASLITRGKRSKRLRESGDGDPDDLDYDEWDARRVRAIALEKEFNLDLKRGGWAPIEILRPLLREVLESDIRALVDDYDKRDQCTPTEVAARGRLIIERIGERIEEALADDSDDELT